MSQYVRIYLSAHSIQVAEGARGQAGWRALKYTLKYTILFADNMVMILQ